MSKPTKRINLYMPEELLSDIDTLAENLGVTRTAYIVMSMSQKVQSEKGLQAMPQLNEIINKLSVMGNNIEQLPLSLEE